MNMEEFKTCPFCFKQCSLSPFRFICLDCMFVDGHGNKITKYEVCFSDFEKYYNIYFTLNNKEYILYSTKGSNILEEKFEFTKIQDGSEDIYDMHSIVEIDKYMPLKYPVLEFVTNLGNRLLKLKSII